MILHNGNEDKDQHGYSSGFLAAPGASAVAHSPSDDEPREMDDKTAPACEEIEPFNINIPVFMERTFRMIDSVSDDIVCWSRAGDSFIVKKASNTWGGDVEMRLAFVELWSVRTAPKYQPCYIRTCVFFSFDFSNATCSLRFFDLLVVVALVVGSELEQSLAVGAFVEPSSCTPTREGSD